MDSNLKDTIEAPVFHEITEKIIGSAFAVMNTLGSGFLEKVYENALAVELRQTGLKVVQQEPIKVRYRNEIVVEDKVLVELKASQAMEDVHYAQCHNYLKATNLQVCMLLNFGKPELQFRRISARKEWSQK